MKVAVTYFTLTCVLFAVNSLAFAVGTIESRAVHFAKGVSSITLEGTLKGDKIVDYTLRAKAGQSMTVMLKSNNLSNYFNILPPGSKDVAFFIGSVDGNEWAGSLPTDGEYKVRVYLMRNAARRSEKANYTMTVAVNGHGTSEQPLGVISSTDAKVEGTEYHATGKVPCSMGDASTDSEQCDFGVIRGGPGHAEVHVTPPGGFQRVLMFAAGKVTSDGDTKVKSNKIGDVWLIEVNDYEHYRIPEAVISGG